MIRPRIVHLGAAITRFWSNDSLQSQVKGRLTFQHNRKTWELAFFTAEEREYTLRALTTVFRREHITTELKRG